MASAVALAVGMGTAPPAAAAERGEPGVLAKGTVKDGSQPLAGAEVIVRLWPDQQSLRGLAPEDVVAFHVVGIEQTDSEGRYSVAVDPASVPAGFVDDRTGLVDVEVIVVGEGSQARWTHSARPGRPLTTRFDFATGAAWEKTDDPLQWVHTEPTTSRAGAAGTGLGPITDDVRIMLGQVSARGYDCDTHPGDIHYNVPERFMWVKGTEKAAVRVTQTVNNEHTMGVAITYTGTDGSWHESGSSTKSFAASASRGGLTGPYYVWNAVNYRDYHNMCAPTYRRPYGYYDLISKVKRASAPIPFPYCTIKRRGYVAETGSARNVTFARGIDVGPISVMSNAGYDHGVDQRIVFRTRRLLCWNNKAGWPQSSRIGSWIPTAIYD